jgi:hypothetical protein
MPVETIYFNPLPSPLPRLQAGEEGWGEGKGGEKI